MLRGLAVTIFCARGAGSEATNDALWPMRGLRAGSHLIVAGSRHEIMMERDAYRSQFWAAFDAFIPGSPLYR